MADEPVDSSCLVAIFGDETGGQDVWLIFSSGQILKPVMRYEVVSRLIY